MSIFRKNKSESFPLIPVDTPKGREILANLEVSGLDPTEVMLVGAASYYLYGTVLNEYDPIRNSTSPRPSDLDLAAAPDYMEDVFIDGTRSGLRGVPKPMEDGQTVLRIESPELTLPIDLISHWNQRSDMKRFSDTFRKAMYRKSRPIEGSDYRIATSSHIEAGLKSRGRSDPKAQADYAAFLARSQG